MKIIQYLTFILLSFYFCSFSGRVEAGAVVQRQQAMQQKARQQAMQQAGGQQQMAAQKGIIDQYKSLLTQNQNDPAVQQQLVYYQKLLSTAQKMSTSTPSQIVQMSQLWAELEVSGECWPFIIDPSVKQYVVGKYIDWYAHNGVSITKPPGNYVMLIDSMSYANPSLLKSPFKNILSFVAIMEYDYNNGQNKDTLAQQVLGQQFYLQNKARLGL